MTMNPTVSSTSVSTMSLTQAHMSAGTAKGGGGGYVANYAAQLSMYDSCCAAAVCCAADVLQLRAYPLPRMTECLHTGLDGVYWVHGCVLDDASDCAGYHVLQKTGKDMNLTGSD